MALRQPWAVQGGRSDAEIGRLLAWAATNGETGVVLPGDLRVRATATPGSSVYVFPGGGVIRSTYATASGSESYVVQNDEAFLMDIPANTTTSSKTYYAIIKIGDWNYEPNLSQPSNPLIASYNSPQLVTSLNQTYPFLPLAKIDIPKQTAAITNAMITDLRVVANPLEKTVRRFSNVLKSDGRERLTSPSSAPTLWPDNGGWQKFDIPWWATRVLIDATWLSVLLEDNSSGQVFVSWGEWDAPRGRYEFSTDMFAYDGTGTVMRQIIGAVGDMPIPARLRGKKDVRFAMMGYRNGGAGPVIDDRSGGKITLTFQMVADMSDS